MSFLRPSKEEVDKHVELIRGLKTLSDTELIMTALSVLTSQVEDEGLKGPVTRELLDRSEPYYPIPRPKE